MTVQAIVGAKSRSQSAVTAPALATSSPQPEGGLRWYVVMTQPGKEQFAVQNLANQGFRSFLPRQQTTYRHSRRVGTRLAAVFPQYLFITLDPAKQRWRAVNGTLGVRRLIGSADGPLPVRIGVVETMLASCDDNGVLKFHTPTLKPGDRVRLVAGPFAGVLGSLQSLSASGRVRLLLEIISGEIQASADLADLSPEPEPR